jgi:response regulator RpfG family c-di-GMP phosphodiesterase/signal transduction histidine kinase
VNPELSNRILKPLLIQFRRQQGVASLREIVSSLGLGGGIDVAFLEDDTGWVSFSDGQRLIDALCVGSGDPQFARRAGQVTASAEALGMAYTILKAFGSPELCYRKTLEVSKLYNRAGAFSLTQLGRSRVAFTYHSNLPEPNRNFCEYRIGQFESFPTIWGMPLARSRELTCQVRGAANCSYEFVWVNRAFAAQGALGALAGAVAAFLADRLFHLPWPLVLSLAGGVGLGGWIGTTFSAYRQIKDRDQLLERQNEDALQAVESLQSRFDELQGLNATLDTKVSQRTHALKEASDKLEAALARQVELDKVKTTFFTNISHELRTPLTLVLAPLETMLGQMDTPPAHRGELEIMHRNSLRLLRHINSILDISRLDAGRERLKLEPTDLSPFFGSLVESARPMAEHRGVRLDLDIDPNLPIVPLDRDKMEKILLNLVSNAIKYSEGVAGRRPVVAVQCTLDNHRLKLTVRDNGIGIPDDALGRIFDRFYQVQASPVRDYQGTGIGLALVKELADLHLGSVNVESQLGEGATFTVEIPVSAETYPPERRDRRETDVPVTFDRRDADSLEMLREVITDPAALALSDLSVVGEVPLARDTDPSKPLLLLVDDNRDMLRFLSHLLGAEYRVRCCESADEGFRLAVSLIPALVLSDLMMPRRTGQDLLRDLRGEPRTRHIPVILLTAKAELQSKIEGLGEGADDYLIKPFHYQELKARIRSLLNQRRLERELAQKNDYLAKLNFDLVLSRKEVFLQTIEALAFAVEAKDPYTHGHSRRVALLSEQLGRRLALSDQECEMIRIAAILHDIGKIGIPESILQKPGPLTPEEMAVIKTHPLMGYRILESVKDLAEVNRCILGHHERFDGSGYPGRHMGIDIPLSSRVVAVSDTYDAMTSTRVYRKGLGHARAIEELEKYAGIQFDPDCVRSFLEMYADNPPRFPDFPSVFGERPATEPVIVQK